MPRLYLDYQKPWQAEHKELHGFFSDIPDELLADLRPLWKKVYHAIVGEIKENFDKQGRPTWQKLNPRYREWKRKKGHSTQILIMTGRMLEAATDKNSPDHICRMEKDSLAVGLRASNFPGNYPMIHDKGGRGVPIPKREFIRLTRDGVTNVVGVAWKYVHGWMKEKGF